VTELQIIFFTAMSICSLKEISILLYQQSCASWRGRETGVQRSTAG